MKKKAKFFYLITLIGVAHGSFAMERSVENMKPVEYKPGNKVKSFFGAIGLGGQFVPKQESEFTQFSPEIVIYGYTPIKSTNSLFWIRPALRFGYAWDQPEMNQFLQVSERDWKLSAEAGVVLDWYIQPSLSVGSGFLIRSTNFTADSSIASSSQTAGTSPMPYFFAQAGLGIPLFKSLIVIEPYVRWMHVFADSRISWTYGVETTVAIF